MGSQRARSEVVQLQKQLSNHCEEERQLKEIKTQLMVSSCLSCLMECIRAHFETRGRLSRRTKRICRGSSKLSLRATQGKRDRSEISTLDIMASLLRSMRLPLFSFVPYQSQFNHRRNMGSLAVARWTSKTVSRDCLLKTD